MMGQGMMQQGLGTRREESKCNKEGEVGGVRGSRGLEIWDGIRGYDAQIREKLLVKYRGQRLVFARRQCALRVCKRVDCRCEGVQYCVVWWVWVFERAVVVEPCVWPAAGNEKEKTIQRKDISTQWD